MGKEIEYNLKYREEGKSKSIKIVIDFLSRGIARDYEKMTDGQLVISQQWNKLKVTQLGKDVYLKEKPPGYKARVKELSLEIEDLKTKILSFDKDTFIDAQYKLIRKILIDNGIENKMLLSDEFWEDRVDVQDVLAFLVAVIYKDFDEKKKVIQE